MAQVIICDLCFKNNTIAVVARPKRFSSGTDICTVCWERIIDKVNNKILRQMEKD